MTHGKPPLRVEGRLFGAGEAAFVPATMWRDEQRRYWLESTIDPVQIVAVRHITPQVGRTPSLITLDDHQRFETSTPLPLGFADGSGVNAIRLLEKFGLVRTMILLGAVVAFLVLFRTFVPAVSDAAIHIVPPSLDVRLGNEVEQTVDGFLFSDSRLTTEQQENLRTLMQPLQQQVYLPHQPYQPQILFRHSELLGANAVALPNGTIIFTDALVELLEDNPEQIVAIYAHELAHVRARHGMRQLLRYTVMSLLVYAVGFDESIVEEIALVFSQISRAGYTRDLEMEADRIGVSILQKQQLDPMALAQALLSLEQYVCGDTGCDEGGMLASHPDIPDRVRLIEGYR